MAKERTPAAGQHARKDLLAGLRLLIVDDNPLTRELLCDGLREGGATRLTEASGIADAVTLLKTSVIDAAVINADFGESSGLAFVRRLRAHSSPKIAGLPCLIVSGSYRDVLESEQLTVGFALYVARRFAPDRLCHHVLRALAARADAVGLENWLGIDDDDTRRVPLVPKPRLRRSLLDLLSTGLTARSRARRTKVDSDD